ncbi:MAG: amidohydrolase family protein [Rubricoccaceae bacterium]
MRRFLLFLLLTAALPAATHAQGAQYRATPGTFAITNARVETVTRGTLERATVVIADGRIAAVGAEATVPAGATVIDGTGLTVYPGFIDSGTRLGLIEIGSVPETSDLQEIGEVKPQMRALTAVNPASVLIPVTRVAGVTTVLTVPRGGLVPGTAALIHLHGHTPQQMAAGFEAVQLVFPSTARRGPFDRREQSAIDRAAREAVERLDEVWRQATLYARLDSARATQRGAAGPAFQPEMAAMAGVVRGEQPLLIEANAASDITRALEWAAARRIPRVILTGVAEGWRVADRIAAAGVPVIAGPVLSLPTRASDRYDRPFTNVALMRQAGVTVALRTDEAENVRNLPFHAGFAVAYGQALGFTQQAALEAVTIVPARLFGLEAELGSVEAGKVANLFLADGDPFEPRTQIRDLFIGGYRVPLVSRQTELNDEYLRRVPGLQP